MKVYVVTSGEYDSYSLNDVYATAEAAQADYPPPEGYSWARHERGNYWFHSSNTHPGIGHHSNVLAEEYEVKGAEDGTS